MATGREPPKFIPACPAVGMHGYDVSLLQMSPRDLPWVLATEKSVRWWKAGMRRSTWAKLSEFFTVQTIFDLIRCGVDRKSMMMRGDSVAFFNPYTAGSYDLQALPVVSVERVLISYLTSKETSALMQMFPAHDYHVGLKTKDGSVVTLECDAGFLPMDEPRRRDPRLHLRFRPITIPQFSSKILQNWELAQPSGPMPSRVLDERFDLLSPHDQGNVLVAQRLEVMWDRWGNWDNFEVRYKSVAREF